MGLLYRTIQCLSLAGVVSLASFSTSCTDPVRDRAIERLGAEDPAVAMGPDHRPGQPCVLCHSEGGPASGKPFAIAGTVFETILPQSDPAPDVDVLFVDANNATRNFTTNAAGNFYVRQSEWSDLAYPFKTAIRKQGGMPQFMNSTVNREGSCNFCHQPSPGSPYSLPGDDPRESVGQIYAGAPPAGGTP